MHVSENSKRFFVTTTAYVGGHCNVEKFRPCEFFDYKLLHSKLYEMSDRVLLKVYYFGQILLQTSEGVKFICENLLDVVIPFIISFKELKGVICEKIDSERARKISCILHRYPIPVFGGFVQFQTKYVTDEASMQEIFSMYIENRAQISFIELYVEFEQSEADRNILREDYNSDSEEEFESNYEFVGPDGDEDQGDGTMAPDVTEVVNALANEVSFEEPSFMRVLDLEAMHVLEFPEYMTTGLNRWSNGSGDWVTGSTAGSVRVRFIGFDDQTGRSGLIFTSVAIWHNNMLSDLNLYQTRVNGEFAVSMEFSSREAVIKVIKEYTIRRSVDYWVYEFEPLIFYAKCTQYGLGCDWLIMVSMISRKYYWVIRRYNGSHTCTRATISQDHSKLDSITIAEAIKPLVEADPSLKVKSVIAEVQSKFNYTVSYQKAWLAKERAVEKIFGGYSRMVREYEVRYQQLREWDEALVALTGKMRFLRCVRCQADWSLQSIYVAFDVTVIDQVRRVYRTRFRPLGNPTTWLAYNRPRFVLNLYLRRITKGRPRLTCFLNQMDTRMLRRPRRCRLCGAEGHNHSRCRQSDGANADRDAQ
ncbi:hypothetical protein Ahy_A07g036046 [Arachis hypogaea]|uniref:Uncharacterized protein n=1 Tax=Arachis hypogaea TaxID=3818 RepID=A0A445CF38_ARAHY|nr:hypothetical protein Ahy_A07g036046 [Arachis hypogaea]